jgi:hypothetical protein
MVAGVRVGFIDEGVDEESVVERLFQTAAICT